MPFNFDSTSPSPPAGKKDVHWLKDTTTTPPNVSGYFDLDISVVSISATGTVTPAAIETIERVTTSSSTITRTLPSATGSGAIILVKKIDSGSGTVVIAAAGSPADAIDSSSTYTLVNQYQYVRLLDAAAGVWDVIGGN